MTITCHIFECNALHYNYVMRKNYPLQITFHYFENEIHYNYITITITITPGQRLTGELIGYPWSSVRPASSVLSHFQTSSPPKPLGQSQILCGAPWISGTKVCSWHLGHMTKMAAMPIYGKNPSKIFFSRTGRPFSRNLVCSIGDFSPS